MEEIRRREKYQEFNIGEAKYRVRKFDAMTGSFIAFTIAQKALPAIMESQLGLDGTGRPQMSKNEFMDLLNECLSIAEIEKQAGFLPILDGNGHLDLSLEDDTFTVMIIAMRAIKFNLESFFSEEGGRALSEIMQGLSLSGASV